MIQFTGVHPNKHLRCYSNQSCSLSDAFWLYKSWCFLKFSYILCDRFDNLSYKHVNYLHWPSVQCRLPNSLGIASVFVDFLRPEDFGLTSPRWAEALVPNAHSRKPSFLILIAALKWSLWFKNLILKPLLKKQSLFLVWHNC